MDSFYFRLFEHFFMANKILPQNDNLYIEEKKSEYLININSYQINLVY